MYFVGVSNNNWYVWDTQCYHIVRECVELTEDILSDVKCVNQRTNKESLG